MSAAVSTEIWINQRLIDLPGHFWMGARVWVNQSNCDFRARVIATSKTRVLVQAENSRYPVPKWHEAARCIVIEVRQ